MRLCCLKRKYKRKKRAVVPAAHDMSMQAFATEQNDKALPRMPRQRLPAEADTRLVVFSEDEFNRPLEISESGARQKNKKVTFADHKTQLVFKSSSSRKPELRLPTDESRLANIAFADRCKQLHATNDTMHASDLRPHKVDQSD